MDEIYKKDLEFLVEGFSAEDSVRIEHSFDFAFKAHETQLRMSGEPYVTHCVAVAKILKEMKMDPATICAGLLHDVLEDSKYTEEDIRKIAGENVGFLVEALSHVQAKVFKTKGEIFGESLRKMFLAMAKDIRVVIIKMADRLHNMRTINFLPVDRQKTVADETLNIYAPLAHRMGMSKIKSELEDAAFEVLHNDAYIKITEKINENKEERENRVAEIVEKLKLELEAAGIEAEIKGRPKHFYSIFLKMDREGKEIEDIYDLIGLRIVTDTLSRCYGALGLIHHMWKPMPGRFKDYIAMPKFNMYQSLHTTVVDEKGGPLEFQIRTKDMDKTAEEGIAAHWKYKEGLIPDDKTDSSFVWLRQIVDWQSSIRRSEDFLKELKLDLFEEEVFVFTPKAEVKELSKGSTILDFAYAIHSNLGDRCTGGKVNGKLVGFKYELKNGDIVEIITSTTQTPKLDWLKIVKTSKAKSRIRHWIRANTNAAENIQKGKELLLARFEKEGLVFEKLSKEKWAEVLDHYKVKEIDDILAAIGYGEISENKITNHILNVAHEHIQKQEIVPGKQVAKGQIIVEGKYADISYKFAKCCNPLPGDQITAIFTKKGLSIHKKECQNVEERKISAPYVAVSWSGEDGYFYTSKLRIIAKNRAELINELIAAITKNGAMINAMNYSVLAGGTISGEITVRVKDQKHMLDIMGMLRQLPNIGSVERLDI